MCQIKLWNFILFLYIGRVKRLRGRWPLGYRRLWRFSGDSWVFLGNAGKLGVTLRLAPTWVPRIVLCIAGLSQVSRGLSQVSKGNQSKLVSLICSTCMPWFSFVAETVCILWGVPRCPCAAPQCLHSQE